MQWQHTAAVSVLEAGGAAALEDSAAAAAVTAGTAGADLTSLPNIPATAPFYYQVHAGSANAEIALSRCKPSLRHSEAVLFKHCCLV